MEADGVAGAEARVDEGVAGQDRDAVAGDAIDDRLEALRHPGPDKGTVAGVLADVPRDGEDLLGSERTVERVGERRVDDLRGAERAEGREVTAAIRRHARLLEQPAVSLEQGHVAAGGRQSERNACEGRIDRGLVVQVRARQGVGVVQDRRVLPFDRQPFEEVRTQQRHRLVLSLGTRLAEALQGG